MTAVAVQARRPRVRTRKPISFARMVKRVADRHGVDAAAAWTRAVMQHQKQINAATLRSAIASKNLRSIEAAIGPGALQAAQAKAVRQPITAAAQAAGTQSRSILAAHGLSASFNAAHPNVINAARAQAAQLVVGVPAETKAVIAEVIALGAELGLTTVQQARAIREVVGLPPNWASAPMNLANEIRTGQAAAATSRRLSAVAKQQIRSRIAAGTITDAFVDEMSEQYAASLINRRALNIARTESLTAAHTGLTESWKQAIDQGVLPETARRYWIVTPDDRLSPDHARIPSMNPDGRGMNEPFLTPTGAFMAPPIRPNCRCSIGLLMDGGSIADEEGLDGEEEALRSGVPGIGPLEPQEEAAALHQLGRLPMGIEGGERVVSTLDVGFAGRIDFLGGNFSKARKLSVDAVVSPRQLYATQDNVIVNGTKRYIKKLPNKVPLVARLEDGRMMVLEGHTRLSAQMLAGRTSTQVRIVGLERGKFVRLVGSEVPPPGAALPAPVRRARVRPPAPPPPIDAALPPPTLARGTLPPTPEQHRAVVETLNRMGVSPDRVTYSSRLGKFSVGEGRSAQFVAGEYRNGRLYLDPRATSARDMPWLVGHEAQHLKFDVAVKTDPKVRRYIDKHFRKLRTEDGTTAYSREWWAKYEDDVRQYARTSRGWVDTIPVNETLAEIQGATIAGEGAAFRGTEVYRKLLTMVDDAYARAQTRGIPLRTSRIARRSPAPSTVDDSLRDWSAAEGPAKEWKAARKSGGVERTLSNHLDDLFESGTAPAAGEELAAVDNYMSYHYGPMNNALRSGNVEEYLKKAYGTDLEALARARERLKDIERLDKLMARMPELGDTATVWRSVDNVDWLAPHGTSATALLEDTAKLIGIEIVDGGFVSTTTLQSAARGWSKLKSGGGTLIEIRLPKNAKGAWMKHVARDAQENAIVKREYLLPRNAKFKVVSARREGGVYDRNVVLHLVMEYLP